ncbi:hypothetical protein [Tomitella gaofuii]|nr:hypothetical protein [Tomitella gaofuii]
MFDAFVVTTLPDLAPLLRHAELLGVVRIRLPGRTTGFRRY